MPIDKQKQEIIDKLKKFSDKNCCDCMNCVGESVSWDDIVDFIIEDRKQIAKPIDEFFDTSGVIRCNRNWVNGAVKAMRETLRNAGI